MSRVALVTGCSSGIGHATALRLAADGWTVVGTVRTEEPRALLAGHGVRTVLLDVTDGAAVQAAVDAVVVRHGRLDAVIANAGAGLFGCFEDVTDAQARALMEVNVHGVWATARAALPHLRASQGHLIVVSSIAGRRAAPGSSVYNASKFALEGWAEALSFETRPFGVRVVLIEPGPTESGFVRAAARGVHAGGGPYRAITARLEAVRGAAMGSPTPADTVANAIAAALAMKDPPLRVPTGSGTAAQILAARLLPWRLYRALVETKLRLKPWTPGSQSG